MTRAQAAGLAVLNLFAAVVTAGASFQREWGKWWLPLLLIGAACAIVSSLHLWYVEKSIPEGEPARRIVTWTGYALFAAGVLLALGAFRL